MMTDAFSCIAFIRLKKATDSSFFIGMSITANCTIEIGVHRLMRQCGNQKEIHGKTGVLFAIPVALLMHLFGIQFNNLIITDVFTPYWESLPGSDLISNLFQDIPNLIVLWTVFFPFLQFFFPVILFPK